MKISLNGHRYVVLEVASCYYSGLASALWVIFENRGSVHIHSKENKKNKKKKQSFEDIIVNNNLQNK